VVSDFFQGFDEIDGGMRAMARTLNFRFTEELDRQYKHDRPDGMPEMPLFRHGRDQHPVSELMYGTFGGVDAQVFEFATLAYPDDPGVDRRTCVLFTFPADFPMLAVGPHTRLSRANERSSDPFRQRYRVTSRDPEILKLVLDENLQSWLLGVDERLRVELAGGGLLGHLPVVEPDVIPVVLQQVYGTFLRIPDAAWTRYGFGYTP
jgi:hypothetical protein